MESRSWTSQVGKGSQEEDKNQADYKEEDFAEAIRDDTQETIRMQTPDDSPLLTGADVAATKAPPSIGLYAQASDPRIRVRWLC
ncbi:hypothetical protein EYF80_012971 [Liparis tanakae]|uniref:Uncharacterized protein n=1 Tax=Liparis tanakae TaxID=230148 RepID=A0A4Z2IHB6_9TELE|nr:hypothetical protein EYF80_012971 [Liparis tanakae]